MCGLYGLKLAFHKLRPYKYYHIIQIIVIPVKLNKTKNGFFNILIYIYRMQPHQILISQCGSCFSFDCFVTPCCAHQKVCSQFWKILWKYACFWCILSIVCLNDSTIMFCFLLQQFTFLLALLTFPWTLRQSYYFLLILQLICIYSDIYKVYFK